MNKNELLNLLGLKIIDKTNEEEVKSLFDLTKEEIEIIVSNPFYAQSFYNIIKRSKSNKNYQLILKRLIDLPKLIEIEEYEHILIGYFEKMICCNELLNSNYFVNVLEKFFLIKDSILYSGFYNLVTNSEVLQSEYFLDILNYSIEIRDFGELMDFVEFVSNPILLKSNKYKFLLDKVALLHNSDLIVAFTQLATNNKLLNSDYYDYAIIMAVNIKEHTQLNHYIELVCDTKILSLNYDDYKFILDKTIYVYENISNIESFIKICKNDHFLALENYRIIIEKISKIKNEMILHNILLVVCNNGLISSEYYNFAINSIIGIGEENLDIMKLLCKILYGNALLKSKNYEQLVKKIFKEKNPRKLELLSMFCSKNDIEIEQFEFTIQKIFETQDIEKIKIITGLVYKGSPILNSDYKSIIDYVISINSKKELESFTCILKKSEFIEPKYFISMILIINIITDENLRIIIYSKINEILDIISEEKLDTNSIFSSILTERNMDTLLTKLDNILNKLILNKMKKQKQKPENRKLSYIITCNNLSDLRVILQQIKDDEDITPDTFVKSIKHQKK